VREWLADMRRFYMSEFRSDNVKCESVAGGRRRLQHLKTSGPIDSAVCRGLSRGDEEMGMERGESGEKTVGGDANKHMNKVPSPRDTTAHIRCRISVQSVQGCFGRSTMQLTVERGIRRKD